MFNIQWKEVLIVSIIIGAISPFLTFTLSFYGDASSLIVNPLLGVIAAGLVLNKQLNAKSSWGIFIGMILTGLVSWIIEIVMDTLKFL